MKRRNKTVREPFIRPEVPGLVPGTLYRRRAETGLRVDGLEGYELPDVDYFPIVEFIEGQIEGRKHAGLGGWFRNPITKAQHFFLAADVEEVLAGVDIIRSGGKGKTQSQLDAAACRHCDTKAYSRGLCSKHYSRARTLVKDEGKDWTTAEKEMAK